MFEGRLGVNPGLNLILFSFSCVQKHFLGQFSPSFLELPIINLYTKRIKTEILFKLSNLNSNLALTLGYLKPALNNSAQVSKLEEEVIIHRLQPRDKAAMLVVNNTEFFFSKNLHENRV